jgi:hypothetical protein
MTPDAFRAELRASLTSFYKDILKVPGAGGRPQAKIIKRRFAGKPADEPADADPPSAEVPPAVGCRAPSPPPRRLARRPLPKPHRRPGQRESGRSWQGRLGQGCQRTNKPVCACNDLKQLPLVVHAMQRFQMRTKMGGRPPPGRRKSNHVLQCTAMYRDRLEIILLCTGMYCHIP